MPVTVTVLCEATLDTGAMEEDEAYNSGMIFLELLVSWLGVMALDTWPH